MIYMFSTMQHGSSYKTAEIQPDENISFRFSFGDFSEVSSGTCDLPFLLSTFGLRSQLFPGCPFDTIHIHNNESSTESYSNLHGRGNQILTV